MGILVITLALGLVALGVWAVYYSGSDDLREEAIDTALLVATFAAISTLLD
jgi:hypothetical protein